MTSFDLIWKLMVLLLSTYNDDADDKKKIRNNLIGEYATALLFFCKKMN